MQALLSELFARQDGVVARAQLLDLGLLPSDIRRMERRRELRRAHPGIYVNHTGPLTRRQREWVAVLSAAPAALTGPSALPGRVPGAVHIAVAHGRKVCAPEGVVVRRIADVDARVQHERCPPRVRLEHALIGEMSDRIRGGDIAGAFEILSGVLGSRQTTAERVLDAARTRERISGRAIIEGMLTDARDGVCSVLERGYRDRVERAHQLLRPSRQHESAATGRPTRQDMRYLRFATIVELDGPAFHGTAAARDADGLRDLAELASASAVTARMTYGMVFRHGCRSAALLAEVLQARGWAGSFRRCPACPPA